MKKVLSCLLVVPMLAGLLMLLPFGTSAAAATPWVGAEEGAYTGDYAFSLAIVGDTQTMCYNGAKGSSAMPAMYQWIVDNVESKNIQYVIGLGDITEKGEDWGHKNNDTEAETLVGDAEWAYAKEAISKMNGVVPYTLVRGSGHDGLKRFNDWFSDYTPYTQNIAGYMTEGNIGNVYHTFEANGTKYLLLCLDFGTKDPALAWASEIIEAHSDHKVIVTTHAYMEKDGSLLETGEAYCPSQSYYDPANNDGDDLWEKLIRKHENIFLVLCGHMTCDSVVVTQVQGDAGNTVTQMLIDPQGIDKDIPGGFGMVAMLYFKENGTDVAVEYYSTARDKYRTLIELDLNHVHAYTSEVREPTCRDYGITTYTCAGCGHTYTDGFASSLGHAFDDTYDAFCNRCDYERRVPKNPNATTEEATNETKTGCKGDSQTTVAPVLMGGSLAALFVGIKRKRRKK